MKGKAGSLLIALVAAAAHATAPAAAQSCACAPFTDAAEQVDRADLIFRGRALSTRATSETFDGGGALMSLFTWTFSRETTFEVIEGLKGDDAELVDVLHYTDQMCGGLQFQGQETYLVFAQRNSEGRYGTDFCLAPQFPEDEYRAALGLPSASEGVVSRGIDLR